MDGSDVPISLLASLCTYAEKILKPLKQQRLIIGGELASDITAYAYFGPHAVPGVWGGGAGVVWELLVRSLLIGPAWVTVCQNLTKQVLIYGCTM